MVIVKELAAELEIQLAAELRDPFFDMFRLNPQVFVIIKSDLHTLSFPRYPASILS